MIRLDSSQFYPGKIMLSQYAGFGIQAQDIPSTGENGPAALYNDIAAQGAAPTDEMMWEILTVPASGVFTPYESSEFTLVGASDGTHFATYRGRRNGVVYGDYTVTMTIGAQAAAVAFTMPQMTVAVSGNVVATGNSASVNFAMPQMVVAASASKTVPVFAATIAATMPQMQVACSADVQAISGVSANIALTMPQMTVTASASTTTPVINASISFIMPQMSVYLLSGEFDYYSSAGTSIETVAASTHIEYTL